MGQRCDKLKDMEYINNMRLMTAGEWREFLKDIPEETQIMFDTNPLDGGSFEYAKLSDGSLGYGPVCFNLTRHGE